MMTDYFARVMRGAGIVFVFSLMATFVGYLTRMLYARTLTPEEFGLFYATLGIVNFFLIFRDLGLSETLVKYIPDFQVKGKLDSLASSIAFVAIAQFGVGLFICIVLWMFSDILAIHFVKNIQAAFMLRLLAIGFLVDGFNEVIALAFKGFQKSFLYAFMDLIKIIFILMASFIMFNKGIRQAPTYTYFIYPFFLLIAFSPALFKVFNIFRYKIKISRRLIKKLLTYSLQLLVGTGSGVIFAYLNTLLLTYFIGVLAVASYNIIIPTAGLMMLIVKPITVLLFPISSELWAKKLKKQITILISLLHEILLFTLLPISFIIFTFPGLIISIFFGEKYLGNLMIFGMNEVELSLIIYAFSLVFQGLAAINSSVLAGIGQPKERSKTVLFSAIGNMVVAVSLVPFIGLLGAAIATTMGNILLFFWSYKFLKKHIRSKLMILNWLKILLSSIIFLISMFIIKIFMPGSDIVNFFLTVFVSGLIYLIISILLGTIDFHRLKSLIRLPFKG